MEIEDFSSEYDLNAKIEIEKVAYLAFFYLKTKDLDEFTISDINNWFNILHFSIPNSSRLQKKIRESRDIIKGRRGNSFRLHARQISAFESSIQDLAKKSIEVISDGSILPSSLLLNKRSYIINFGKQINASYTNNLFDACAVLMRRLLEICLIHTYENFGIESQIKISPDKYRDLKFIIKDAATNTTLSLTKESKECMDEFRLLGNLSAHHLYYNCKIEEIDRQKLNYRLLIEELFNKAGRKAEK